MKALIYKDVDKLEIEDVPTPVIGEGQVLVRTDLSGICGSDVSMVKHGMARPDTILGHEPIGTVAEMGSGVEDWRKGDKVLVKTRRVCGRCAYCRMGHTHLCEEMGERLAAVLPNICSPTPTCSCACRTILPRSAPFYGTRLPMPFTHGNSPASSRVTLFS